MRGAIYSYVLGGSSGPRTFTISLAGNVAAPVGVASVGQITFVKGVSGSCPAASGGIAKRVSKNLAGSVFVGAGDSVKKTIRGLSGSLPAPIGALQEMCILHQAVVGVMGSITGSVSKVLNPVIVAVQRKIKIIGAALRKVIGG